MLKWNLKLLDTVNFINKDNSNRRKSAQFLYLLVKNCQAAQNPGTKQVRRKKFKLNFSPNFNASLSLSKEQNSSVN